MLPVLSQMRDGTAYLTFTALHAPVYALLILALSGGGRVHLGVVVGLDVFFVVHVLLHLLFVGRTSNRFDAAFSWVRGALDLLMLLA